MTPSRARSSAGDCGRSCRGAASRACGSACSESSGRASSISYISSVASCATQPGSPAPAVILNVDRPADRTLLKGEMPVGLVGSIKLSQTLKLKGQGLRSIGALGHEDGTCVPCLMETRHRKSRGGSGDACRLGFLCGRCHEDH